MIAILAAALVVAAIFTLALYLNAAARGHGPAWRRAFTRAWRNN